MERVCKICGKIIERKGNTQICVECKTKICEECGKKFIARYKTQRFCSKSCWHKSKELAEQGKVNMSVINKKYRKENYKRMTENNPAKDPKVRTKIKNTQIANGTYYVFNGKRGGNGAPLSQAQKVLALALQWKVEIPIKMAEHIPVGGRKKWCDDNHIPTCYKIDIGNEILKIAIEVDGKSHYMASRKEADRKKTKWLNKLGWKVLRFTNKEILTNISKVLSEIQKEIQAA